ncbi:hypothetical protein PLESTB_000786000 [Pleodorina starrii]|uniref:Ankyrin repeat domain-containing protein n=1 Tax=Pleodorina starrii TaxID=330485 RepID=A0A9W6F2Z8_9CHLO|nr:hypothetical protein PLESTM_000498900 [Pleodorina starrii]GLC53776.1 hypothetical protein PLESTB_000786000 [Pleodorina starrii]GLC72957.1 hypothetical protein PLESTF_001313800 [Pleodorina starrii]
MEPPLPLPEPQPGADRRFWDDLPPEVATRITACLPHNELACTVRLLNKATLAHFRHETLVHLSEPAPHHAFLARWGRPEACHCMPLKQRRELLRLVARSGDVAAMQVAVSAAGCCLLEPVLSAAAAAGHLDMCRWLLGRRSWVGKDAVEAAARGGHLAVVRLLLTQLGQNLPPPPPLPLQQLAQFGFAAWAGAAGGGHRALCETLLADGIAPNEDAPIAAARGGHRDLLHWLLELVLPKLQGAPPPRLRGFREGLMGAAAFGLDLASLQRLRGAVLAAAGDDDARPGGGPPQGDNVAAHEALCSPTPDWRAKALWLRDKGARPDAWAGGGGELWEGNELLRRPYDALVRYDNAVERIELMLQLRNPGEGEGEGDDFDFLFEAAARASNLPLVRFLGKHFPGAEGLAVVSAAEAGSLPILRELFAVVEMPRMTWVVCVAAAARGGHLRVLQWLTEPGAARPGAEEEAVQDLGRCPAAEAAAESGSLEVLRLWAERGFAFGSEEAFRGATRAGNPAVLEWLVARGCPLSSTGEPYLLAALNGDLATLRCLRRLGCPWGPSDGAVFSQAVHLTTGASRQHVCAPFEVLSWLQAEGCPVDWQEARRRAQRRVDPEAAVVRVWVESRQVRPPC